MKYPAFLFLFLIFPSQIFSQELSNRIYGKVTDGYDPVYGVKVEIEGHDNTSQTDINGHYEIYASPRSELIFTRVGFDSIKVIVEDITSRLNIVMHREVQELDEVTVTDKRIPRQKKWAMNYYSEPSIINTGRGYMNNRESAFHFYVLDKDEINFAAPDIVSVINGRIPGARVRLSYTGERYLTLRTNGSLRNEKGPVYEVDGVLFTQTPTWLILDNILRIGVIPGLHASLLYGSVASGGLVVINTVNGFHGLREEGSSALYDQALLRNNFATNNYLNEDQALRNGPKFLNELILTEQFSELETIIEKYKSTFSSNSLFVIETYRKLYSIGRFVEADDWIKSKIKIYRDDPVFLKSLAYTYDEQKRYTKANDLYKEIFKLRPRYAQSYLDLAQSYYSINEADKGYIQLIRLRNLQEKNYIKKDTSFLQDFILREMIQVNAHNDSFNISNTSETFDNDFFGATRLTFEWSDSEAEFEIQFINPSNQYYIWNHSLENSERRIRNEKIIGFSCYDNLIDSSLPGQWSVRINYHGNKKMSHTYFKARIIKNFGMENQLIETKVFPLYLRDNPIEIANFYIHSPSSKMP